MKIENKGKENSGMNQKFLNLRSVVKNTVLKQTQY